MGQTWDWQVFLRDDGGGRTYLEWLMSAWGWTLSVAELGLVVALVVGSLIGIIRTVPNKKLAFFGEAWTELFRNIPLLVQMFLWYFVLPELVPGTFGTWMKQMPPPWGAFVPAVLCLGFFTSARIAEQVKAGIQSLPRGQGMAGTALGLTLPQTYRHVLLPMAYRIILPPLTSEFMNIIKNSSVALTIGLVELTAAARSMQEFSFQVFEAFTAATTIYLLVNVIVVFGMRIVERKVSVPGFIGKQVEVPAGH